MTVRSTLCEWTWVAEHGGFVSFRGAAALQIVGHGDVVGD